MFSLTHQPSLPLFSCFLLSPGSISLSLLFPCSSISSRLFYPFLFSFEETLWSCQPNDACTQCLMFDPTHPGNALGTDDVTLLLCAMSHVRPHPSRKCPWHRRRCTDDVTHFSCVHCSLVGARYARPIKVTGSLRGGCGKTICSTPFFSHKN